MSFESDFDGRPLSKYPFFIGAAVSEKAQQRVASAGDYVVHVSDAVGTINMVLRTPTQLLHIKCVRDNHKRVWLARVDASTVLQGATLGYLVEQIALHLNAPPSAPAATIGPRGGGGGAVARAASPSIGARHMMAAQPSVGAYAGGSMASAPSHGGSFVGNSFGGRSMNNHNNNHNAQPQAAVARANGGGGGGGGGLTAAAAGLRLATEWGLAQLPCFYASDQYDAKLGSMQYLIRVSSSSTTALVIVCKGGSHDDIKRILFQQLGKGSWRAGSDPPISGTFAEFVRVLLPPSAAPLNDILRMPAASALSATEESLQSRVESFSSRNQALHSNKSSPLLHGASAASALPQKRRFNGVERAQYGNITMAMTFSSLNPNDTNVIDGTRWTGVAWKEALATVDRKHDDLDGVSMATEKYYFYDLDKFGANSLLAGREVGSFLLRLDSTMTQFVIGMVRDTKQPPVSILIDFIVVEGRRCVMAAGGRPFPTVRELVRNTRVLISAVSRHGVDPEFVDCELALNEKPLGVGAGGVVYKAVLNNAIAVAVKRLKTPEHASPATPASDQLSEAEAMLKVPPHPYINRLFGIVMEPLSLVFEFCDGGSLDRMLGIEFEGDAKGVVLSMPECRLLALQIAQGIAHLHSVRVVHRDLATRNILIERPLTPKVCDFGMSRVLAEDEQEAVTGATRGPVKWQAPEQLHGERRRTGYKTDVFSFAVMLTEIINNWLPWKSLNNRDAAVAVVSGKRTVINPRVSPHLRAVIEKCWQQDADARPTMQEVVGLLEDETFGADVRESLYDDV